MTAPDPPSTSPGTAAPTGASALPDAVTFTDVAVARGGRITWTDGTFSIAPGAVVGVIGPNGSGKTTLLHLVLGLLTPSTGDITVFGQTPRRGNPRIGYVPQHYTADVGHALRCRDLVALGRTGHRWGWKRSSAADRAAVDTALAAVGATEFADHRLSDLSGGQQQRVAIAQAIVNQPDLLLLDEPLASLDLRHQQEIVNVVQGLAGITTFIVAHDLNPLLNVLTGAIYLLDGHAHYDTIGNVVDEHLLTHLYGTAVKVVRTPQGDLFTRSAG